jgi:hypothetical protein
MQALIDAVKRTPEWHAYLAAQRRVMQTSLMEPVPDERGFYHGRIFTLEEAREIRGIFATRDAQRLAVESLPGFQRLQAAAAGTVEAPSWSTEAWELLR